MLSSCSPFYVLRAGYEQGKLLINRQPIEKIIAQNDVEKEVKEKLELVLKAREFGITQGLNPGGSFLKYSHIESDALTWIVLASKKDSFSFHTWWFPIVGSLPYKGFFKKEHAEKEAHRLELEGYETIIMPTEAYSTLGWFDDPVVTTSLRHIPPDLVNTVLHESVHTTVWIPGDTGFNESVANFIGLAGAEIFFSRESQNLPKNIEYMHISTNKRNISFEIEGILKVLYDELKKLYESDTSLEDKLKRREKIFIDTTAIFKQKYPGASIFNKANNAEIMHLMLYYNRLSMFNRVFDLCNNDLPSFIKKIKNLAKIHRRTGEEAFALLDKTNDCDCD